MLALKCDYSLVSLVLHHSQTEYLCDVGKTRDLRTSSWQDISDQSFEKVINKCNDHINNHLCLPSVTSTHWCVLDCVQRRPSGPFRAVEAASLVSSRCESPVVFRSQPCGLWNLTLCQQLYWRQERNPTRHRVTDASAACSNQQSSPGLLCHCVHASGLCVTLQSHAL